MSNNHGIRELMFTIEMARKSKLHPIWSEMGLIAGQPRVLSCLLVKDCVTQKELAAAGYIDPATLSRALDRLEAMGYINRNANPDCRRSFHIALTEAGRNVAVQVQNIFAEFEVQMLLGFDEKEANALMKLMRRVYENVS